MTSRLILISGFELNVLLWQQIQLERSKYKMLVKKKVFRRSSLRRSRKFNCYHTNTNAHRVRSRKQKKKNTIRAGKRFRCTCALLIERATQSEGHFALPFF